MSENKWIPAMSVAVTIAKSQRKERAGDVDTHKRGTLRFQIVDLSDREVAVGVRQKVEDGVYSYTWYPMSSLESFSALVEEKEDDEADKEE